MSLPRRGHTQKYRATRRLISSERACGDYVRLFIAGIVHIEHAYWSLMYLCSVRQLSNKVLSCHIQ